MIKIGYATDYAKRLKDHMATKLGVSVPVKELCALKASQADEGAIHRYFAKHKVDGEREIFHPNEEVTDYIRWLRDQYYVWVPEEPWCPECNRPTAPGAEKCECGCKNAESMSLADCEIREPSDFLPNADRRKSWGETGSLFSGTRGGWNSLYFPRRVVTADDFYTNPSILAQAKAVLGGIDLDPASHPIANREVGAKLIYTRRENGLNHEWFGRIWLNPPFSEWQFWVPKIVSEWRSGRVTSMCVLCATRTLTAKYFSPIHENATSICILTGRIPFWGGYAKDSPDDGHAIFYFGPEPAKFAHCFGTIGNVFRRMP